jgi:hypothetical protein
MRSRRAVAWALPAVVLSMRSSCACSRSRARARFWRSSSARSARKVRDTSLTIAAARRALSLVALTSMMLASGSTSELMLSSSESAVSPGSLRAAASSTGSAVSSFWVVLRMRVRLSALVSASEAVLSCSTIEVVAVYCLGDASETTSTTTVTIVTIAPISRRLRPIAAR